MANDPMNLTELVRQVRERLALEASLGVTDLILPKPPPEPAVLPWPATQNAPRPPAPQRPAAPLSPEAQKKAEALSVLEKEAAKCKRCGLCDSRTHLVFGVGNPDARLMFVGEAPGADEDRLGEPFVGRAGQLLTRIITQGMKMQRADVYIANILKCRPPGNRPPAATEMVLCKEHLLKQIDIIRPATIVALGAVALNGLTDGNYSISRARGQFLLWRGLKLMPTFHPAYLLRNPSAKREVWEDIKKVLDALKELSL